MIELRRDTIVFVEGSWSGMSGVSLPVTRPVGRALIVGNAACRMQPATVLTRLGFSCAEVDDPYGAMIELCRRPLVYRALILSLAGLYREELAMIESVKQRFPHVEIWLSQTDGRQASLAEAMRLGADGLVADDGMHRTAIGAPPAALSLRAVDSQPRDDANGQSHDEARAVEPPVRADDETDEHDGNLTEPVLTADELRALLQDQPSIPPGGRADRGGVP